jgi:hypothetical protein
MCVTEAEWQKSLNGSAMMAVVSSKGSERLWRLLAVASVRRLHDRRLDPHGRRALDVAERVADGTSTEEEWQAARTLAAEAAHRAHYDEWVTEANENFRVTEAWTAADEARVAAEAVSNCLVQGFAVTHLHDRLLFPDVLREIIGNPFQWRIADPAWCSRNNQAAQRLATAIYDDRTFERLPMLADALEDAGCTDAELLGHLRGPGSHVRGCWAVDLVLGKS